MGLTSSLLATDKPADKFDDPLKPFVENFKGRGALDDGSKPASPEEALKKLKLTDGLAMQVAAHEPAVAQPLNMYFDERGRLWVTQYLNTRSPPAEDCGVRQVSAGRVRQSAAATQSFSRERQDYHSRGHRRRRGL